jgi:hypothetical protein
MPLLEAKQTPDIPTLELLRDLYDRIPFVRGRTRDALLHRLRRVSVELRQARMATPEALCPVSRAAAPAGARAADTAGARELQAVSDRSS